MLSFLGTVTWSCYHHQAQRDERRERVPECVKVTWRDLGEGSREGEVWGDGEWWLITTPTSFSLPQSTPLLGWPIGRTQLEVRQHRSPWKLL